MEQQGLDLARHHNNDYHLAHTSPYGQLQHPRPTQQGVLSSIEQALTQHSLMTNVTRLKERMLELDDIVNRSSILNQFKQQ